MTPNSFFLFARTMPVRNASGALDHDQRRLAEQAGAWLSRHRDVLEQLWTDDEHGQLVQACAALLFVHCFEAMNRAELPSEVSGALTELLVHLFPVDLIEAAYEVARRHPISSASLPRES